MRLTGSSSAAAAPRLYRPAPALSRTTFKKALLALPARGVFFFLPVPFLPPASPFARAALKGPWEGIGAGTCPKSRERISPLWKKRQENREIASKY